MTETLDVDGRWQSATAGGIVGVINLASERVVASVAAANCLEVDLAFYADLAAASDETR